LRRLVSWTVALVIWAGLGGLGLVAWYAYDLPDVNRLGAVERSPTVTLLDVEGREIASFGALYSGALELSKLPPALPQAVLATEDRRFYDHFGLDLIGLARAAYVNLRQGRIVQGGSTITQQLAKNLFLTPERTLKRKIQETLLALWLEHKLTKDQILTLYLERVYLGAGTYGVDAAARKYFRKPATRLGLAESAMLAGLLKAPSRYAPTRNPALARARGGRRRAPSGRGRAAPRAGPRGALFRRLGARAGAALPRPFRARPGGRHDPRFAPPRRRRGRREGGTGERRRQAGGEPGGAGGAHPGGRGAGHGGRPLLCREPVQPRHPGAAPARLRLQAVRLSRRPRGRARARRRAPRRARSGGRLAAPQLLGPP
jgi:hypothetical protein